MNTTPGSAEVQLAELFWRYEAEGVLALKAARDQHSFTDQSETTQAKWLGYARVALAFGFEAGAKPAEEGVGEASASLPTSQFAKYKTVPELEAENAAADRANIKRQIDNATYIGLHKGNYGLKHYLSDEQKRILSESLSTGAPKP